MRKDVTTDVLVETVGNKNLPVLDDANSHTVIDCNVNEKADMLVCNNRLIAQDVISRVTPTENPVNTEPEIKPLSDITVNLQDIKPGIQ